MRININFGIFNKNFEKQINIFKKNFNLSKIFIKIMRHEYRRSRTHPGCFVPFISLTWTV